MTGLNLQQRSGKSYNAIKEKDILLMSFSFTQIFCLHLAVKIGIRKKILSQETAGAKITANYMGLAKKNIYLLQVEGDKK